MTSAPKNIRDLVGQNELYAQRVAGTTQAKKVLLTAQWAERDGQRQSSRPAGAAPTTLSIALNPTAAMRDAGVLPGIETAKAARAARLKEKFEREALQYEQELGAMGLALAKRRD